MARRRRCPNCGSKQWHKEPSSGLIACSEGHILQNYINEAAADDDFGGHAMKKRAMKSERQTRWNRPSRANPKLYYGPRAQYLYFQCQQLLLRKQIAALRKIWDLPPEFEVVCRDIWALHLHLLPNPPPAEPYNYAQETKDAADGNDMQLHSPNTAPGLEADPLIFPFHAEKPKVEEDQLSSSLSSDDEADEEVDSELADLLQENSEISSSGDEEGGEKRVAAERPQWKKRNGLRAYEGPVGTVAVLMVACWILRIPILCRDFGRIIESYELPYLDPVRLLPASMVVHLNNNTIQALSPHHAPSTLLLHAVSSRLTKGLRTLYGIFTPEANGAPILWRVVRALGGTPTFYSLTKRLSHILSLPLTLNPISAPGLARARSRDPEGHKYDNVPPELSLLAACIIVLKMVYGLDGTARKPGDAGDPALALPRIDEYLSLIRKMEDEDSKTKEAVFSSQRATCMDELEDGMVDKYLEFCEQALLGRGDSDVLGSYFPLEAKRGAEKDDDIGGDDRKRKLAATMVGEEGPRPGQEYRIYSGKDVDGNVGGEYETIVKRGGEWVGVERGVVGGIVEVYERRVVGWWEKEKKRSRCNT